MPSVPDKFFSLLPIGVLCVLVLCGSNACTKNTPVEAGRGQDMSALEQDILREVNRIRTDPPAYAATVSARKAQYDKQMAQIGGNPSGQETQVFEDAIRTLRSTAPMPALTIARGLAQAARDHVRQASTPPAALTERLTPYGTLEGSPAENVAYGSDTAERFVMQFVLDPNDDQHTQRANLLQPGFARSGIACGAHPQYTTMCVVIFARQYRDKTP